MNLKWNKWVKCPAVREGGKSYFSVLKHDGNIYHVVWDRIKQAWDTQKNHVSTGNYFKTENQGKKHIVNMILLEARLERERKTNEQVQ